MRKFILLIKRDGDDYLFTYKAENFLEAEKKAVFEVCEFAGNKISFKLYELPQGKEFPTEPHLWMEDCYCPKEIAMNMKKGLEK